MDEKIRDLERRAAADPSDDEARLALAVSLVRSGNIEAASEKVDPATASGYRLLVERAAREPSLLPLLDRAPEWRSSGGDPGCSRWSKAAPVTSPRTIWRRRIEGVHAALGVAVDRGIAYVVTLGPAGTELVAISVLEGRTLWRFGLGFGPPAAPLARAGRVHVATFRESLLTTEAISSEGRRLWRRELGANADSVPGALNATGTVIVVPVATTWRSSRLPAREERALYVELAIEDGAVLHSRTFEQIFAEAPVRDRDIHFAVNYVTDAGRIVRRGPERGYHAFASPEGPPQFMALAGELMAIAVHGTLHFIRMREHSLDESSVGGNLTSLALDEARVLVGRGAEFSVRDARTGSTLVRWSTHESPLPYRPRGVAHAPAAPRSAVCAGDLCYLASPLSPSLSAFDVRTGQIAWRHELEGLLVPEEGPRFSWPIAEVAPPDRGPLYLAPLPGLIFGITLSGYAFLVG